MKVLFLVLSIFVSNSAFADVISIPPQYVCIAVDDLGDSYQSGGALEFVDVQTFSGLANDQMIVEASESAMKNCITSSKQPQTCDLISCLENPQ